MKAKTMLPNFKPIKGLSISRKIGDVIVINQGDLLIQITEISGRDVKVTIQSDKDKYVVERSTPVVK